MTSTTQANQQPSSSLIKVSHRVGVHLLALLILVQAVLAGRALFGTWSITMHGVLGNITFTVALAVAGLALLGRVGKTAIAIAIILAGVLTAQIGLGYVGREAAEAAAWHVPLGVLAFGIAVYQATLGNDS